MPGTFRGKALLLGCCAALAGCQVAGAPGLSRTGGAVTQRLAQSETEQGRAHLRAQRNGLAIEAFNRALVFGEAPAPALNGLGVAYARLGRADLAYRFFSLAASADPASAVYAGNLARLTSSPGFTLAALRTVSPSKPAYAVQAPDPGQPGKLFRDGERQFSLITAPRKPAAIACAVSFKGARPEACNPAAVPVVGARNKANARPAGPGLAERPVAPSTRKVVSFDQTRGLRIITAARP